MTRPAAGPLARTGLVLAIAVVAVGCVASAPGASDGPASGGASGLPSAGESASTNGGADATANATSTPTLSADASPPTTTETAWGRIWDTLPATFPAYPGAQPADAGQGPASAVVAVPAKVAKVVTWYRQALVGAGYSIEALAGPMEDGGTVIDAVGLEAICRVQATIGPRGSQTTITILFAAACPFR